MSARILVGDVRAKLAELADDSVHCVVTSVPYWGLRDYGLEPQVWGGAGGCQHSWGEWHAEHDEREPTKHGKTRTTDRCYGDASRRFDGNHQKHTAGRFCTRCNAWRGSLGLEPTPDLYLEHMVAVFREVRRVMRADSTCWLNIGDCYAGGPNGRSAADVKALTGDDRTFRDKPFGTAVGSLKAKDLVLMPARLALALQADGWWVRSDIIWAKPNPMPESIRDRPTSAHEHVFLLSKAARYFYDAEAVRENYAPATIARINQPTFDSQFVAAWGAFPPTGGPKDPKHGNRSHRKALENLKRRGVPPRHAQYESSDRATLDGVGRGAGRNLRNVWNEIEDEFAQFLRWKAEQTGALPDTWRIATEPYREAHFATFPTKLVEPCILARDFRQGLLPRVRGAVGA